MLSNISLKTIDNLIVTNLLPKYDTTQQPTKMDSNNNINWINNILSNEECQQIITQTEKLTTSPLTFPKTTRDATRLAVLDKQLAQLLWTRLQTNVMTIKQTPFGFD